MTALVPTTGHADLIDFALQIPGAQVYVMLNGRLHEPLKRERIESFLDHFSDQEDIFFKLSQDDNAPQNPEDMPNGFWKWWRDEIKRTFGDIKWDYVVASETYGIQVANSLQARFIPYDIERHFNSTRGTDVRNDLWGQWNNILPEFRQYLQLKVTLFGQESVGKTTIAKKVAEILSAQFVPEYARPFLETVGPAITPQSMEEIHMGQYAWQKMAVNEARYPVLIQDTDLYSTIGYYQICKIPAPTQIIQDAFNLSSDIYYVLPDNIAFEPDPIRYGIDKRESSMQFWIDLLDFHKQNYMIVPKDFNNFLALSKAHWIVDDISKRFQEKNKNITNFKREVPTQ